MRWAKARRKGKDNKKLKGMGRAREGKEKKGSERVRKDVGK